MVSTRKENECPAEFERGPFWIYLCFFASGAAGLIYEVLWIRMLGLVFGHTVFAITTVLTAFMAGLALGSYLFGRIADRRQDLLRLYGLLEMGIGLYGLMIPLFFFGAEKVYLALYRQFHLSFYTFSLLQFLLIFLILTLPTTLMGGTLPILGKFFSREVRIAGRNIGMLYTLNTFGAVAGTFAAGFYLLPLIGVKATLFLAVAMSLGIGLFVLVFDRRLASLSGTPARTEIQEKTLDLEEPVSGSGEPQARVVLLYVLLGFGLSGAASMMYEVAWFRVLSLIIGSSTYAFTSMLIAFLAGLAFGSWIFARYVAGRGADPFTFSLLQLGIGASALLVLPLFARMPEVFLWAFKFSSSPRFLQGVQFSISFMLMLFPTVLMGATFPCAVQILTRGIHRIGFDIGMVYSVNTVGAIVGTFSAGFLLIPIIGVQSALKVATSINLLVAAAVIVTWRPGGSRWRKSAAVLAPLVGFVVLFVVPQWDKRVLSMGAAIYADRYLRFLGKAPLGELSTQRLLYYRDGISSTVSVHRGSKTTYLAVNGKTDASTSEGDMRTQLMLGHLPLLLHPDTRDILVIGLGSGITVGAMAQHPVRSIDVVEIEPGIARAAGFFLNENRNALADPRVQLVFADGRNFVRSSDKKYDVIVSEPSNPWIRGIGSLFSVEFFQLGKERLNASGLFCQWIQGYGLHPDDLRMVVNTFRSVFPHTTIWSTGPGDFLLIGARRQIVLDYQNLSTQFRERRGLREDMLRLGLLAPGALLADFVLGEEETARYVAGARLNTDDLPLLEFSAPLSLYARNAWELNVQALQRFRMLEFPPLVNLAPATGSSSQFQYDLGTAFVAKKMLQDALDKFNAAMAIDPRHLPSLLAKGDVLLELQQPRDAEESYRAALKISPRSADAHVGLARVYQQEKIPTLAIRHVTQAIALEPHNPSHRRHLGEVYRSAGRFTEAISSYREALKDLPAGDVSVLQALGIAYKKVGRLGEAIKVLTDALSKNPEDIMTRLHLGTVYRMANEYDRAEQEFRTVLTSTPLCAACYAELGQIHLLRKERRQAVWAFRKALKLEPSNIAAQKGLEAAVSARF